VAERELAANWKLLVEQWLESPRPQQQFVAPNLLLEAHPEGAVILQVIPLAPARSRLQRFDFAYPTASSGKGRGRADATWPRDFERWLRQQSELAESTQAGLSYGADEPSESGPIAPALIEFRGTIAALLSNLPTSASSSA
jgi:hypothetical protein